MKKNNEIKISGCIIALNSEKDIQKAIISISKCVEEIIVVDGGSKDKTATIAKKFGAKTFFRKWDDDFGKQRDFAIKKSQGQWILMIDTDEEFSLSLCKEIKRLIQSKKYDGYWLPRKNYIDKKPVKSNFALEKQLRLFRRYAHYDKPIHEVPIGLKNVNIPDLPNNAFIKHMKIAKIQKKHLIQQKAIMEKEYTKAIKEKDKVKIAKYNKMFKNWEIWWKDANLK